MCMLGQGNSNIMGYIPHEGCVDGPEEEHEACGDGLVK